MSTDLEQVSTALVEFDKVGAGLAQLQTTYKGMLYDVETPNGMAMAKAARLVLRTPRFEIEKIRKAAKAPLLAIGKKLDTEAARITAAIMELEEPIDQQIKNEEDRKEREKAAAEAAEAKRVSDLQHRIAGIRNMAMIPASCGSEAILARHDATKALPLEGFAELTAEATAAKDQTVAILFGLHSSAVAAEAEAARVAAERAELARLRAEQAERDAEARKAQEAEQARQAEELRREREQLERDRADQERAAKVERDRVAAERAEQERIAAAERAEAEKMMQAERDRLAAERARQELIAQTERDRLARERQELEKQQEAARLAAMPKPAPAKRPSDAEIVQVVANHFSVEPGVAMGWLSSFTTKGKKAA